MKISKAGSSKAISGPARKKAASGKDCAFAEVLKQAATVDEAAGMMEPSTIGSIDAILAVQEVSDSTDGRSSWRQARDRGEILLDRLAAIQHGLLNGTISKDELAELAQAMRAQRIKTDDPRLNGIIDEIELRVEVELAKFTRDP